MLRQTRNDDDYPTIHGKNIIIRALEPVVSIGDMLVRYPEIALDERRIIGFLTEMPEEGARRSSWSMAADRGPGSRSHSRYES